MSTVNYVSNLSKGLYSQTSLIGHRGDETKCSYYGGVPIIEVEFVWNLVSFGPCGLYVNSLRGVPIIEVEFV